MTDESLCRGSSASLPPRGISDRDDAVMRATSRIDRVARKDRFSSHESEKATFKDLGPRVTFLRLPELAQEQADREKGWLKVRK